MYNLHALTELAPVASPVLNHHIAAVLPPLFGLSGKAPGLCKPSEPSPAAAATNGDAPAANGPEKWVITLYTCNCGSGPLAFDMTLRVCFAMAVDILLCLSTAAHAETVSSSHSSSLAL